MSKALLQLPIPSLRTASLEQAERHPRGRLSGSGSVLRARQDRVAASERAPAARLDLWEPDPEWLADIAAIAEDF